MFRPSRRLGITLLWIAIALLPLRGLATSLMPASLPLSAPVVATADAMPCHGADAALQDEAGAHHQAHDAASAAMVDDCPTCALCALCHGGVAQAPTADMRLPALPSARPAAAPPSVLEPRAPDGLFRPPRNLLA